MSKDRPKRRKPRLGVMPTDLWKRERLIDLADALFTSIDDYRFTLREVAWCHEMAELVLDLKLLTETQTPKDSDSCPLNLKPKPSNSPTSGPSND